MEAHESDIDGSVSGPDMSEEDDDSRMSNNSPTEQPMKPSVIDPDVISRLKQHGMPFGQEDLERLPFFFTSPHLMASHLAAAAAAAKGKDMLDHRDRSPIRGYPDESLPANQAPHSDSSTSSTSSQQTWSFEEQFKQLYELSDDMKRKEFLDELFSFMQKRGTPINRLPIMAKQVLDLYELYNLVIARGGLVDVINKKLWQEIIKGLHLPSSITSAAFTLRTQYMKYLYPYECDKKRLSTPNELQAAIDGNRREGRRASYGPYPDMVSLLDISPLSLVGGRPQMNGNGTSHPLHSTSPNSPPHSGGTPNARDALAAIEMSRLALWNLYGAGAQLPEPKVPPQQEALNLEVPARNSDGSQTPKLPTSGHSNHLSHRERETPSPKSNRSPYSQSEKENGKRKENYNNHSNGPPVKKERAEDTDSPIPRVTGINGTHIKINSRGDGRGDGDNSMVVSMEINGITYQGVLFAQSHNSNSSTARVS